jgi:hypothetical protein
MLGVRFEILTIAEATDRTEEFIRAGVPRMILARNAAIPNASPDETRVLKAHSALIENVTSS